ncbi:uncharacterized protein SPPG_07772 [Spizellomyces punctatus DAOM BR117]|uniref:RING-type domain-containing protein n=1 Tax=Spizellomyces punctatus (strain DAOM BR117) TaxID=645134 RepID=A0A0L0H6T5_SPIPD|nr:uncharacterized protein SPPG_07772 [Spizellomyces punctatus DAOM BR117]KNC96952.1 hypothetical protein SPPG_07772 [Spizellomyces punctatus DAOM BR117]|eukprot:XP_016604992.1 hypothetical protein SPPG_07772 [Spizellomyces punctatus DAOM BR117]
MSAAPPPIEVLAHGTPQSGPPLSDADQALLEAEARFAEEHRGHEKQHATMALILIMGLIISQLGILVWKKYHIKSFQLATLLGLWIVPPIMGFQAGNMRYVFVWVLFSLANGWIVRMALQNPMQSVTPRLVYKWYTWVYNLSYGIGVVGYVVVLLSFFHIPVVVGIRMETEIKFFETGVILLFYGLYFGTLSRDFVERLSDRMATTMGYYSRTGFPRKHLRSNMCAICGDTTTSDGTADSSQKLHRLGCGHTYHEKCIRGWTIIGKKDSCPYCKEKVDLKAFKKNPWDTSQMLYLNLLDALRYMIVWNPIIFLIIHLVFEISGLK